MQPMSPVECSLGNFGFTDADSARKRAGCSSLCDASNGGCQKYWADPSCLFILRYCFDGSGEFDNFSNIHSYNSSHLHCHILLTFVTRKCCSFVASGSGQPKTGLAIRPNSRRAFRNEKGSYCNNQERADKQCSLQPIRSAIGDEVIGDNN